MSERQAKKKRKIEASEVVSTKRKKTKAEILTNAIIAVLIVALVGLGSWAVYGEIKGNLEAASQEVTTTDDTAVQQTAPTVAEYANTLGMSTEEFLAEYGLDTNSEVNADMDMTLATEYMTLGNYAKMVGQEVADVKTSMGIDDSFDENSIMSDIFAVMQEQVMAEAETTEAEATETDDAAETEETAATETADGSDE